MNTFFSHWLFAFLALRPLFFAHLVLRSIKKFSSAALLTLTTFSWVFVIDGVVTAFFGAKIISFMIAITGKQTATLHPLLVGGSLVMGIMTFLLHVFFVLFLRRDHFLLSPKSYIQAYFFNYVQFLFFVSFAFTLLRLVLFAAGITQVPELPEFVLFLIKVLVMFALFFWLDSNHSIKSLLRSFERATNLLIYSLPVIVAIVALSLSAITLLMALVLGFDKALQAPYGLTSFINFFVDLKIKPSLWQIMAIKYLRALIDGITVALLYTWYRRKRTTLYAAQLFTEPTNNDESDL
jgi:hypothetical protein